jgi:hypothetical protein
VRQGGRRCRLAAVSILNMDHAPVAQLDRALPSEGRGQGFESLRARQARSYIDTYPQLSSKRALRNCSGCSVLAPIETE